MRQRYSGREMVVVSRVRDSDRRTGWVVVSLSRVRGRYEGPADGSLQQQDYQVASGGEY